MFIKETQLKKWEELTRNQDKKRGINRASFSDEEVVFTMTINKGKIILTLKKKYPDTFEEWFADYEEGPLDSKDKFDGGELVGREFL